MRWVANADARAKGLTPPVFIVVCHNTNVSKMVYRVHRRVGKRGGWGDESTKPTAASAKATPWCRPEALDVPQRRRPRRMAARPNTILVDSQQLESGGAMSAISKRSRPRDHRVQGRVPAAIPGAERGRS